MVSSKEVAKIAGVSQATVSRVLNNSPNVRKETREKVQKAIEELQYQPNMIARSLVLNRTKTIAYISGSLDNPFYSEMTTSIINLATKKGYNIFVYFENQSNKEELLNLAVSNNVAGIIQSTITLDDSLYDILQNSQIPYITINRKHQKGGNYVVLDNHLAGRMAMEHLIQLGHERIGIITGPDNISTFLERKEGCLQLVKEKNISLDSKLIKVIDTSKKDTVQATFELLNTKPQPTAILCATDYMALTVMDTLISTGKKIPEQISVIGIDDIDISGHSSIQLTSVAHNIQQMGELAVNSLISMIEDSSDEPTTHQLKLLPYLVVRKTTSSR